MQLLMSQTNFLVLSICIPKRIDRIISEVQLWKKNSFLVLTSGKFLEALGGGIGTGSIFCLSFSLSNRVGTLCIFNETVKVRKFWNENMKSSHYPKHERKCLKNSALKTLRAEFFKFSRWYFGQHDDFIFSFLNFLTCNF